MRGPWPKHIFSPIIKDEVKSQEKPVVQVMNKNLLLFSLKKIILLFILKKYKKIYRYIFYL
jgi:hypothetical protein